MEKIRYEVDPHNRLTKTGPEKFRTILDGEFKVGDNNELSYHVKKSDGLDVPQQIKFSGDWSLDEGRKLVLTLDKWNNQVEGNKLVLKSELLDAGGNELVFSIEARDTAAKTRISILKFSGAWQADKHNRLVFNVAKEDGAAGKLTLQGKWEINKQNEVIYTYAKNILTFRGYWDITTKDRLLYVLNKGLGSRFDFKVSLEKAVKDSLRYGVSIGYGAKKRSIALFGNWKIDKDLGLSFEIGYTGGNVKAEAKLLKTLSQGQGEAYIKTLVSEKEFAVMAGAGFRW